MNRLISALRLGAGLLVVGVVSVIFAIVLTLLLPWRALRVKVTNLYGKIVGKSVIWLAGVTLRFRHRERLKDSMPAIFLMNHTSTLDAFIGSYIAPIGTCGVFKKEVAKTPFYGQIAILSGHLLLDRQNFRNAVSSLDETARLLSKHRLGVFILPEGTRSADGRLLPFKRGFVHMALATKFKVVPIVVSGAHKNWKLGELLNFKSLVLPIDVLEPIDTSTWKPETAAQHAAQLHDLFVAHLPEDQHPLPKNAASPSDTDEPNS